MTAANIGIWLMSTICLLAVCGLVLLVEKAIDKMFGMGKYDEC